MRSTGRESSRQNKESASFDGDSTLRIFGIAVIVIFICGCASGGNGMPPERALASAKIHTELAASYYDLGKYSIALQEIQTALKAKSDYAPAFNVRGRIHFTDR